VALPWGFQLDQHSVPMISPFCGDLLDFILSLDAKSWQSMAAGLAGLVDLLDTICDFSSALSVIFAGLLFVQSLFL
jgi:hypothetical protein